MDVLSLSRNWVADRDDWTSFHSLQCCVMVWFITILQQMNTHFSLFRR
jgi:hypothetical protein